MHTVPLRHTASLPSGTPNPLQGCSGVLPIRVQGVSVCEVSYPAKYLTFPGIFLSAHAFGAVPQFYRES